MSVVEAVKNSLWYYIRKQIIYYQHQRVARYWDAVIRLYLNGEIEHYTFTPKFVVPDKPIIWQYWGQGCSTDAMPEIVRICFQSVEYYCGDDYTIIRLSDENLLDYIDLPDFVVDKWRKGVFNRTFFSDMLRLCLLRCYGGVWLDVTILLTGKLPSSYLQDDFFMFQRDKSELHKQFWEKSYAYYWGWGKSFKVKLLTSIIFAAKDSRMIAILTDLMLFFWKTQSKIPNYFFFQILFNQLVCGPFRSLNCALESDVYPHIMQTKINNQYPWISFQELLSLVSIHKMTYFSAEKLAYLKEVLKSLKMDGHIKI